MEIATANAGFSGQADWNFLVVEDEAASVEGSATQGSATVDTAGEAPGEQAAEQMGEAAADEQHASLMRTQLFLAPSAALAVLIVRFHLVSVPDVLP